MQNDARIFMDWLFARAVEDGEQKFLLWSTPSKSSYFLNDIDKAREIASGLTEKENVYIGCGLIKNPPEKGRGELKDISGIVGFWADIDYGKAGMAHTKNNLPTDEAGAMKVVREVGLDASIITHSGNGLQAWWLFKEPWIFKDDDDRLKACRLSRNWVFTIRAVAQKYGWTIDSVFDLTRVLRLPGTLNHKTTPPKPSRILEPLLGDPVRWGIDDFERMVIAEEFGDYEKTRQYEPVSPVMVRECVLTIGSPLYEKIMSHCENDAKFKRTWKKARSDLKDQSASGYDLSIASTLVMLGCTDQEIADSIIAWRTEHRQDLTKAMRRDYLMRTIGKARTGKAAENAVAKVMESVVALPSNATPEEVIDDRKKKLEMVSKCVGVKISRFIQHGCEGATYSLVIEDLREIVIGPVEALLAYDKVRARVAEVTGVLTRSVTKEIWHKTVEILLPLRELIEDDEGNRSKAIVDYLRRYLYGRTVFTGEEWSAAFRSNEPYTRDGTLNVHVGNLGRFLRLEVDERVGNKDIRTMLRMIGFKGRDVSASVDRKVVTRTYWGGPANLIEEPIVQDKTDPDAPAVVKNDTQGEVVEVANV